MLPFAGGCFRAKPVQLVSYADPYFPETRRLEFTDCACRVDGSKEWHVLARGNAQLRQPGAEPVLEYLDVHMFWTPRPGRTFADATSTDALLRYVLASERGVSVYRGTGFVYPHRRWWQPGVVWLDIESGQLQPNSLSGEPPEPPGALRVRGTLRAADQPGLAVDILRELELRSAGTQSAAPGLSQ